MTEGERRIYNYIANAMIDAHKPWRGNHVLTVEYRDHWPTCECCKQDIRTNPELAYQMFLNAELKWNGKQISHETLRGILLGFNGDAIDSESRFRNPGSYGIDPFREWGRRELGKSIVLADIDNAVRRYGQRFALNGDGDLMLIEKKERWLDKKNQQLETFQLKMEL